MVIPPQHARRLSDLLRGHLQRTELLLRVSRLLPRLQGPHHGEPGARRGQAVLQVSAEQADHRAGQGKKKGRRLPRGLLNFSIILFCYNVDFMFASGSVDFLLLLY